METNRSAVMAFWDLLEAVENGEEVFLLRSSDALSHLAMQEYNDNLHGNPEFSEDFVQFVDELAENFEQPENTPVRGLPMSDETMLSKIARALSQLSENRERIVL